jgi:hypothetical protein
MQASEVSEVLRTSKRPCVVWLKASRRTPEEPDTSHIEQIRFKRELV